MLIKTSAIKGYAIIGSDGAIGSVSDFLFDDSSWMVRWLVVETGSWLFGRKVLLPPSALGHPDATAKEFPVRLTMQQIKDSPDVGTERSVSRQMETVIYDHYGWSPYWGNGFYMGGYGYGYGGGYMGSAMMTRPTLEMQRRLDQQREHDDPHLRSIDAVTGYHIHATDGEIGHVEDFLADDTDWSIHYLVVDTKNWWPAKKVLISPRSARTIDWQHSLVNLDADRRKIKEGPAYDASTVVDRTYEDQFASYYGAGRQGDPKERQSNAHHIS